jgi:hypothetical protein
MEPPATRQKPRPVILAVKLLWIFLAIGIILQCWIIGNIAVHPSNELSNTSLFSVIMNAVFMDAVFALLIVQISRGKKWARGILLFLAIIGLPSSLFSLVHEFTRSPIESIILFAQIALQIYTLSLIYNQPGANWFHTDTTINPPTPIPDPSVDLKCENCGFVAFGMNPNNIGKEKCLNCGLALAARSNRIGKQDQRPITEDLQPNFTGMAMREKSY